MQYTTAIMVCATREQRTYVLARFCVENSHCTGDLNRRFDLNLVFKLASLKRELQRLGVTQGYRVPEGES